MTQKLDGMLFGPPCTSLHIQLSGVHVVYCSTLYMIPKLEQCLLNPLELTYFIFPVTGVPRSSNLIWYARLVGKKDVAVHGACVNFSIGTKVYDLGGWPWTAISSIFFRNLRCRTLSAFARY